MPLTEYSDNLHATKYREPGETFREAMNRVAAKLKDNDKHYHQFREILTEQRFLPAGRIQAAVGSTKAVTAMNCYVSSIIADSLVDGEDSIMDVAKEAARTMRMGGGIGYDFSTLRPRGELINKLRSHSTGPVSFMHIFDAVCRSIASAGHRRGAQMGVMRVDHPDISEFLHAKHDNHSLTGFNISIAITDEFMEAVINQHPFDLRFGGRSYKTIEAVDLWEDIMRSTWDWAEPGVIFIDKINEYNNLWYCETIYATNPCAEQPLPPNGACLLGSFNLVKYLTKQDRGYVFDWEQLKEDVEPVVRAMDNVTDITIFPLERQRHEAQNKRRMGLGVTGLANAGEALGFPYGSSAFLIFEANVLGDLKNYIYEASVRLAREKGAFPLWDSAAYDKGKFIRTLDPGLRAEIKKHGIRNSHLTSIAPTGTISSCADNVSSGIEPVFAYQTKRPINLPGGTETFETVDYGFEFLHTKGKISDKVTAFEHITVLTTAQRQVDSSVSKTVNMTGSMPWNDFKNIYLQAWENNAKGCTTFNQDGSRKALLVAVNDDESCKIDPETGVKECG